MPHDIHANDASSETSTMAFQSAHASLTMKHYKPLVSSAPANSILNAQEFNYRNSANTDIRKTFANFRRNASKQKQGRVATNVRTLRKNPLDATLAPFRVEPLRWSSG